MDEVVTIAPPPAAAIGAPQCRAVVTSVLTFTVISRSHASSGQVDDAAPQDEEPFVVQHFKPPPRLEQ